MRHFEIRRCSILLIEHLDAPKLVSLNGSVKTVPPMIRQCDVRLGAGWEQLRQLSTSTVPNSTPMAFGRG